MGVDPIMCGGPRTRVRWAARLGGGDWTADDLCPVTMMAMMTMMTMDDDG